MVGGFEDDRRKVWQETMSGLLRTAVHLPLLTLGNFPEFYLRLDTGEEM
jgi:hypothetical protein